MANHSWQIGDKIVSGDTHASSPQLTWSNEHYFSFELYGKRYNGEVISINTDAGTLKIKINHRVFDVTRKRPINEIISQLGLDQIAEKKLTVLKSPMPGKVLDIKVKVGQEVNNGDSLLTLEAMKMENVIKAEGIGTVKSIAVKIDNTVEKDAILIEFE